MLGPTGRQGACRLENSVSPVLLQPFYCECLLLPFPSTTNQPQGLWTKSRLTLSSSLSFVPLPYTSVCLLSTAQTAPQRWKSSLSPNANEHRQRFSQSPAPSHEKQRGLARPHFLTFRPAYLPINTSLTSHVNNKKI